MATQHSFHFTNLWSRHWGAVYLMRQSLYGKVMLLLLVSMNAQTFIALCPQEAPT